MSMYRCFFCYGCLTLIRPPGMTILQTPLRIAILPAYPGDRCLDAPPSPHLGMSAFTDQTHGNRYLSSPRGWMTLETTGVDAFTDLVERCLNQSRGWCSFIPVFCSSPAGGCINRPPGKGVPGRFLLDNFTLITWLRVAWSGKLY